MQTTARDPTRVTIQGLPRAAQATLRVQERSHAIDLSTGGKGARKQVQQTAGGLGFAAPRSMISDFRIPTSAGEASRVFGNHADPQQHEIAGMPAGTRFA